LNTLLNTKIIEGCRKPAKYPENQYYRVYNYVSIETDSNRTLRRVEPSARTSHDLTLLSNRIFRNIIINVA